LLAVNENPTGPFGGVRSDRSRSCQEAPLVSDPSVLIVDDEESFVDALVVCLEREAFVVSVAGTGSRL
jgi:PleD family two-component response regulator